LLLLDDQRRCRSYFGRSRSWSDRRVTSGRRLVEVVVFDADGLRRLRRRVTLLDVFAHPVDGGEGGLAVLAAERPLARVLEQVADERIFVPELDAADVAAELFLAPVNLKKSFIELHQGSKEHFQVTISILPKMNYNYLTEKKEIFSYLSRWSS